MSKRRFVPEYGGEYWYISDSGEVNSNYWYDDYDHKGRLKLGNVFKTKEEAEKAVEKLKALRRLRDMGLKLMEMYCRPYFMDPNGKVELGFKVLIDYEREGRCLDSSDLNLLFGDYNYDLLHDQKEPDLEVNE